MPSYSSALRCFICSSFFTEFFIAFCRIQVAKWMPKKAPPATHNQFLLSQLGFFMADRPQLYNAIHKKRKTEREIYFS